MFRTFLAISFIAAFSLTTVAQKIEKPTLQPKACTEEQRKTVLEGIALHDAKKFAAAVTKYEQVIAENPDCTLVQYELSMTYFAMGEKTKAMETAHRGSKYKSAELPLFYVTMANVIDDVGKPKEAIKIYRDAIKMLKGEKDMVNHLSSVHYNLAVTLVRQKSYDEARAELKNAVEYDNQYASPHYLLSIVYNGTRYKMPAFLAAARFLSLEFNSQRSKIASNLIREILKPAPKDKDTGSINIFLDLNAPKDEGDFAMFDLLVGTLTTVRGDEDKNKTADEMFVDAVGTVIALMVENKDLKSTFVGKNYVPFMVELKKRGYAEVLGYLVLYHSDSKGGLEWLTKNDAKLKEFIAWSKAYSLPN